MCVFVYLCICVFVCLCACVFAGQQQRAEQVFQQDRRGGVSRTAVGCLRSLTVGRLELLRELRLVAIGQTVILLTTPLRRY